MFTWVVLSSEEVGRPSGAPSPRGPVSLFLLPLALTPNPPPHSQASSSSSFIFTFDLSLSRCLGREPYLSQRPEVHPLTCFCTVLLCLLACLNLHQPVGTTRQGPHPSPWLVSFPGPHSCHAHNRCPKNRSLWGKKAVMNSLAKICRI